MNKSLKIILGVVGSVVSLSGATAFAKAPFLKQFSEYYTSQGIDTTALTTDASCGLCHNNPRGGGARNAYGAAAAATLNLAIPFASIEAQDSDADKFTNIEELFANTAPGSSTSVPDGKVNITQDKDSASFSINEGFVCESFEIAGRNLTVDGEKLKTVELQDVKGAVTLADVAKDSTLLAKCLAKKVDATDSKTFVFVGSLTITTLK